MKVYTFNPYKTNEFIEDLSSVQVQDLFYNKIKNFHKKPLTFLIVKDFDPAKHIFNSNSSKAMDFWGFEITTAANFAKASNSRIELKCADKMVKPGETNPWKHQQILDPNAVAVKKRILKEGEYNDVLSSHLL